MGSYRGVPDISSDSNPDTGVWVFYGGRLGGGPGWYVVGGTSVAAPTVAGIVNLSGHFASSTTAELTTMYANRGVAGDFRDINYGFCGPYSGFLANTGWDLCSGIGSPLGLAGK